MFSFKILALVLIFPVILIGQLIPIDLSNWSVEGNPANGNWVIAPDSLSVLQTINGAPTFFVGPDILINTVVRGNLKVETTGDDDFIGFVFGYQRPVGNEDYFEFILLDWKQITQTWNPWTAQEGLTLSKVQGTVTGNLASGSVPYWDHSDSAFVVLDTDYGADRGWLDNTEYTFELIYESNRIRILIDSVMIFNITGDFPAGRFGFYNYSQSSVRYRGFALNQFPVAVNDTVSVRQDSVIIFGILDNDTDPDRQIIVLDTLGQAAHGKVTLNPDSTVTYKPETGFFGTDSFFYTIRDELGAVDTGWVIITVEMINSLIKDPTTTIGGYTLWQNYPNPFNPFTTIEFSISKSEYVETKGT